MDEQVKCCIDDEPLTPPYNIINGRAYCDKHFAMVNMPNPGLWRASLLQVAFMGVFSALLAYLASYLGPLSRPALVAVGVFLALVPSALWLFYFYRQDRLEPEPKTRVLAVFLLALVLQDVLGRRVIDDWFHVSSWAPASTSTSLLASILIVGVVWQAIAYIAVRALVYNTNEFDERMDGIVYGTVAGLGVATLLNLRYVLDNGGVALAPGVIQVTTTALAQAAFGGLMGYFMAQAKFEHRPFWWVPLGFALAAALNGLTSWLLSEVSANGLTVNPWRSLGLGIVVALATFLVLVWLMSRTSVVTLARPARRS